MIQTNTEYMSDKARVERTVQRFMNITIQELGAVQSKKYIDFITDEIIPREGLSAEKAQNMSYIEFACLIYHVGGNHKYDWHDHDSLSEQMFYFRCIAGALLDGGKVSIPIKLFLSLPLIAFYTYMDRVSAEGKNLLVEYSRIKARCQNPGKEGYTIRDFLLDKMGITNKAWIPINSLAEYESKIRTAYKDIGGLLVDSFHMAFPYRFHIKDIRDKYQNSLDEEGYLLGDDGPGCGEEALEMVDEKQ